MNTRARYLISLVSANFAIFLNGNYTKNSDVINTRFILLEIQNIFFSLKKRRREFGLK
jgi:hypothetical protein